ncbi:hypothetical protein FB451DRAFT_1126798 [Mycena latifolia]|nr:hypothetical protein FB451DRAFT_1126798 [Mycena latifolia]
MAHRHALRVTVTALLAGHVGASHDCFSRFEQLRQGLSGFADGGTDNYGNPANITSATGMTYALCLQTCGAGIWDSSGGQAGRWLTFSQTFSTWLLPFLAMVSQLPFGGDTIFENGMSILLNIGSPTLAAYSVTLTVLNNRWIYGLFYGISYPNVKNAVRALQNLQQSPVEVIRDDDILASLIVLPENDEWWSEFLVYLDIKHAYTWSFANVTSIIWVVVAFSLTVIDAYTNIATNSAVGLHSNGLAVGFAWLWLLAILTCYLNAGPRCDTRILRNAIQRANSKAYVATHTGHVVSLDSTSNQPAISLEPPGGPLRADEGRPSPIYNYTRLVSWSRSVLRVHVAFSAASRRAAHHIPVASDNIWDTDGADGVAPANRRGSIEQLVRYIQYPRQLSGDLPHEIPGLRSRSFYASCMALGLTWGTIGSAILLEWSSATQGLACRSGGYLIYALNSTIIWAMLLGSSHLTYSSILSSVEKPRRRLSLSAQMAILLRRAAKTLACLNAIWIVLTCTFQFAGVYETCWCNSSPLYQGSRAYTVMFFTETDVQIFWKHLVTSTALTSVSTGLFIALNICLNPSSSR